MAIIGNHSESAVALSDTVEIAENVGFEVNQDCTLVFRLRGDSTDSTWSLTVGRFYPWDIKLAKSTGSTAATTLLVVHGKKV